MVIEVRVPATSANLGPGFDVLGLALGLYNEVVFQEAEGVTVTIEGEGAGRLDTGADNVVARAVRIAYEAAGCRFPRAGLERRRLGRRSRRRQCRPRLTAGPRGDSGAGQPGRGSSG